MGGAKSSIGCRVVIDQALQSHPLEMDCYDLCSSMLKRCDSHQSAGPNAQTYGLCAKRYLRVNGSFQRTEAILKGP